MIPLGSRRSSCANDPPILGAGQSRTRNLHKESSETPPGEEKNLLATLTVRAYVWIVTNWTLQQKMAIRTECQVQLIAYQAKLFVAKSNFEVPS